MPTNVVMPQMGESIAEGTLVRWMKRVGDRVEKDEPLFEISTDKVDTEVPSPVAGILREIRVKEGETVPVDTVVAVIGEAGETEPARAPLTAAGAGPAGPSARAPEPPGEARGREGAPAAPGPSPGGVGPVEPLGVEGLPPGVSPDEGEEVGEELGGEVAEPSGAGVAGGPGAPRRVRTSPLVRRLAREHGLDLSQIAGTGAGGRVTRQDVLRYLEARRGAAAPSAPEAPVAPPPAAPPAPAPGAGEPLFAPGEKVRVVPMSVMRKKIAEHMVASVRTSPHVYSVFDVDFTRVAKIREARKADYARAGVKLTYLAFIAKAVVDALRAVPIVNASLEGDQIVYKRDINLGIAVALDWGLIVPVIKHADEKNVLGLSRAIQDLAERARAKQLKPEEVQEGTFTITNPGTFGTLFGMPIINQPQVAILGVGVIEKRPVVVDDAIAIRWRAYLSLGYDHRLIDGAVADQFMSHVKRTIEQFDPSAV
jgi:pyruvate dehydrogenase E2 component (dihydrolipoamide acetyltransferase)